MTQLAKLRNGAGKPRARRRLCIPLLLAAMPAALAVEPRASAALPPALLDGIAAQPVAGAQLPLSALFVDDGGTPRTLGAVLDRRPAVLIFADYTCRTLCGPILEFTAAGLEKSGLRPGTDYGLVVVGLDPKDGLAEARAMRSAHFDSASAVASATTMLVGDQAAIAAVTSTAGYRAVYDAEHDQFAHPAAAYVVTGKGKIARVLSGLGLDGNDLRLALVEAGEGRAGTFIDRIRLLCYGFDPAHGVYTAAIERWVMVTAAASVIAVAGWIVILIRFSRRRVG